MGSYMQEPNRTLLIEYRIWKPG